MLVPFDAVNEHAEKFIITGSLFAETQEKTQYLGHSCIKHDVTVDIIDGDYQSVVGRVSVTGHALGDAANKVGHVLGDVIHTLSDAADALGNAISSTAGDLLQWVKDEVRTAGRIVQDTVTGVVHFVAEIGGKIYHAVLDTVHAVVGAVTLVFEKVKTGIKKLIQFVEMLFHWDDISRGKDVMHNAFKLWMQHEVDNIPKARDTMNKSFDVFKGRVKEWVGTSDWSSLGDASTKPNKNQTSGTKFLANHYRNHASQLTVKGESPPASAVQQLVNDLVTAISKEGVVLEGAYKELRKLAKDFGSLGIEEIPRRLVGILGDAVLSSVQVVINTLLALLHDVAQSTPTLIDTKIHIRIISDLLNKIGVPDISFLDLLCWIAVVGFTVVYKVIEQAPPFPKNDSSVQGISSAKSWDELQEIFGQSDLSLKLKLPKAIQKPFFEICHGTAGFLSLIGNPLTSSDAMNEAGKSGILGKVTFVLKVVVSISHSVGDALIPQYPVKNSAIKVVLGVASGAGLISSLLFSSTVQSGFGALGAGSLGATNTWGFRAIVAVILIPLKLVVFEWHFYELTLDGAGDTRSAAILGEVSNLASYASRISYALAVNEEDPDTRLVAMVVKAACDDAYSGLQVAETVVGFA